MKTPKNMSEQEVVDTITKVARHLAPKYVFASYDIEDIFQEAFIIGIEGLEKYDEKRPLSNFLFTHISNRLKNFKRNNYYRLDIGTAQQIQDRKKSLLEPLDIEAIYSICTQDKTTNDAYIDEVLKIIDEQLPSEYRRDYLKLQTNSPLPKGRKTAIIKIIQDILQNSEEEDL
tara:strand:- start:1460 stop:1978 length:519 start_codon:yes stop_codon:yes gene_type:complete